MTVVRTDLVFYASQDMPENNIDIAGGAINSGFRVSFDDLTSNSQVAIHSSITGDNYQTGTLTGRTIAGTVTSENIILNGTEYQNSVVTYERILKFQLQSSASGIVTIRNAGNPNGNIVANIPAGESGIKRPFFDATASISSTRTYYEKIFAQNRNVYTTLNSGYINQIDLGLSDSIVFALEDTKQYTGTIANREAVPTGISGGFGEGPSGIVSGELTAGDYQGVWLKLSLQANNSPVNSFYELQISGITA